MHSLGWYFERIELKMAINKSNSVNLKKFYFEAKT